MRIQHNISALNTYRQMGTNNTGSAKSLEKLSSGYKINRAGDDAAGLAISEKMRAQINGLNRASANSQDGISLIQAAEGALQESESILQRMRELAVQAGNDVNETEDRKAIQDEINQLTKEIDRIAYTTEFNKKTLLDGSLKRDSVTAKTITGSGVAAGITTGINSSEVVTEAGLYNIEVATLGVKETAAFTVDMTGAKAGETQSISLGSDIEYTPEGASDPIKLLGAGTLVVFQSTGNTDEDNATAVNLLKDAFNKALGDYYDVTSVDNKITVTEKIAREQHFDLGGISLEVASKTPEGEDGTAIENTTIEVSEAEGGVATVVNVNGNEAVAGAKYGTFTDEESGLSFTLNDPTKFSAAVVEVTVGRELTLQVGANEGVDQTISVGVQNLSAAGLGVDNLTVNSNEAARAALAAINTAITTVSDQRASLGAVQNRLEHTTANLDTVAENLQDAESRIRDVDVAKEMMNFTKYNILMQASQAMMAQANSQPQGVLQLLR